MSRLRKGPATWDRIGRPAPVVGTGRPGLGGPPHVAFLTTFLTAFFTVLTAFLAVLATALPAARTSFLTTTPARKTAALVDFFAFFFVVAMSISAVSVVA